MLYRKKTLDIYLKQRKNVLDVYTNVEYNIIFRQ